MGSYTVIDDITDTLVGLLRANMSDLIASDHISARSPADVTTEDLPQLSLFLYQVAENKQLKNQDPEFIDETRQRYPPLALQLFYMLSAHARTPEAEFLLTGRAMQVFYDHSVISGSVLKGTLAGSGEELVVAINALSIDDLNKLWSLFGNKSYKLSVGYQVSTALIDSMREEMTGRVIEQAQRFVPGT